MLNVKSADLPLISVESPWDLRHILLPSCPHLARVICWFWLSDFCLTTDPSWRVNDLELFYVVSRLIWDWFSLSALFSTPDFFVHISVGNVSFFCISVSITYKGFLQNWARKCAKLSFFALVTLSISMFYKLNVSFGDETDNSSYLAGQKDLWQAEIVLYFFIRVPLFFQKHCIPLQ